MPFGILLTHFLATKRVSDFPNDTFVEVRKKLNAQTIHQSETHLPHGQVVPSRPIYINGNLTMGERMENLEATVA